MIGVIVELRISIFAYNTFIIRLMHPPIGSRPLALVITSTIKDGNNLSRAKVSGAENVLDLPWHKQLFHFVRDVSSSVRNVQVADAENKLHRREAEKKKKKKKTKGKREEHSAKKRRSKAKQKFSKVGKIGIAIKAKQTQRDASRVVSGTYHHRVSPCQAFPRFVVVLLLLLLLLLQSLCFYLLLLLVLKAMRIKPLFSLCLRSLSGVPDLPAIGQRRVHTYMPHNHESIDATPTPLPATRLPLEDRRLR